MEQPVDPGHMTLVLDLATLLDRAKKCKYHDFHENGYDAPKMELVSDLMTLVHAVKIGAYDN